MMNYKFAVTLTALALALSAQAQASDIKIETGYSAASFQSSAADYRTVVDAAVAMATSGYGASNVAIYDGISNQNLFGGSATNIAFKSTVTFDVSSANVGVWEIRSGVDFGLGGALFVDGTAYDFKASDMWWAGSYNNAAQYLTVSLNLGAGSHVLNLYGLEQCCDGTQQAQFKTASSADFTTFSSADGLAATVPEPDTYAMMLVGLGLMGFASTRSRRMVS